MPEDFGEDGGGYPCAFSLHDPVFHRAGRDPVLPAFDESIRRIHSRICREEPRSIPPSPPVGAGGPDRYDPTLKGEGRSSPKRDGCRRNRRDGRRCLRGRHRTECSRGKPRNVVPENGGRRSPGPPGRNPGISCRQDPERGGTCLRTFREKGGNRRRTAPPRWPSWFRQQGYSGVRRCRASSPAWAEETFSSAWSARPRDARDGWPGKRKNGPAHARRAVLAPVGR